MKIYLFTFFVTVILLLTIMLMIKSFSDNFEERLMSVLDDYEAVIVE